MNIYIYIGRTNYLVLLIKFLVIIMILIVWIHNHTIKSAIYPKA